MTKKVNKSRYNPKKNYYYKQQYKSWFSTPLPSNLQSFKQKLLFGNGFITYKVFYI